MTNRTPRSTRACDPCRARKLKCDGVFPTCDRCTRRGRTCTGLQVSPAQESVFRNENEAARLGSERARLQVRRERPEIITLEIRTPVEFLAATSPTAIDVSPQQLYPWLNKTTVVEIPEPLRRDPASLAVERFFDDWTSLTRDDGFSGRKEYDVPVLYRSTTSKSILWYIVRAMAYAHVSPGSTNGNNIEAPSALYLYGEALHGLRGLAYDDTAFTSDEILVSLLMVDAFESLYLGRNDPLGAHSSAVVHSLRTRGDGQLYDQAHFSLWAAAHNRLLARQLLLTEDPIPEQENWLSKLNTDNLALGITAQVHSMLKVSSLARCFLRAAKSDSPDQSARANKVLVDASRRLTSVDEWEACVSAMLSPVNQHQTLESAASSRSVSIAPMDPRKLLFRDFWLKSMWNFICASQVAARESLISVLQVIDWSAFTLQFQKEDLLDVELQRARIRKLCENMISSAQHVVGLMSSESSMIRSSPQGTMAVRTLAYVAMTVVQEATSSLDEQRKAAAAIVQVTQTRPRA